MKVSATFPLALAVAALSAGETRAFGAETETQKKQDQFFKCLLAIGQADSDEDGCLTKKEFNAMTKNLGDLIHHEHNGALGDDVYDEAVKASNPPKGTDEIDVFGADVSHLFAVNDDRIESLRSVCELTIKELKGDTAEDEVPELFSVKTMLEEEAEEEEEEEAAGGERNLRSSNN